MIDNDRAAVFGQIMYGLASKGLNVRIALERALFGSSSFIKFTVSYYTPNKTTIAYTRAFAPVDLTDIADPNVIVDAIIEGLAVENKVSKKLLEKWLEGDGD